MSIDEFKRLVELPIKWSDGRKPGMSYSGRLTGDIYFHLEFKSDKMVLLHVPIAGEKPQKYPNEIEAETRADEYAIEHWIEIIDNHLEERLGQMDLFSATKMYSATVEEYRELKGLSNEMLWQAYFMRKNGKV